MNERQLSFFSPMYRVDDLETCKEAAQDAAPRVSENQMKALRLIAKQPRTDYDLAAETGLQQTSIGKRRCDLYHAGLVEPEIIDGQKTKRPGPSGSMCIVWRITQQGIAFLKEREQ